MSFRVGADEYDRFMGRYSQPLAPRFAEFAGVAPGQRVLDVGCGPGALTTELVRRVGADAVWAVDPSERFVDAARARLGGVRVQRAAAEHPTFEEWWEPFLLGVGPAGSYVAQLGHDGQARLRELCKEMLPPAPFVVTAHAWTARGLAA